MTAGYSKTPLHKKLGVKPGCDVVLVDPPDWLAGVVAIEGIGLLTAITRTDKPGQERDIIHYFTKSADELFVTLPTLKSCIRQNGMIWVSWPKKASKVPTDITEDVIRNYALSIGLVDVKVCAVDDIWSGLKLVIPVKDRTK